MCDLCDRPDLTADDVLDNVRSIIARRRFALVSVDRSVRSAEFTYTVGLTEHGLPELVVMALPTPHATELLTMWGDYLLEESLVLPGELMETGPWLLEAVDVVEPEKHLLLAHRFYRDRLRALQLVWADDAGRWPWDRGHRARRAGQPVLGPRAPFSCGEHAPDRLDVPPHL